jgi:hypothetical protein
VKKTILALLTSAALAAGLSGCFAPAELDEGPAPTPPAAADAPVPEDAVGDTAEAPEVETPELTLGTLGGDGFVYDDGLKVVISAGEAYQPSEWAAYEEAPAVRRDGAERHRRPVGPVDVLHHDELRRYGDERGLRLRQAR